MQTFAKLSTLLYFLAFVKDTSSQTTTSLYYPGVVNAGGVGADQFILASVAGSSGGTTTFVLAIGSTNKTLNAELPGTPTVTLVEASNTAHLFGSYAVDNSGDSTNIDIECDIGKNSAACKEVVILIPSGAATKVTDASTFTETVSSIPVTLVSTLTATPTSAPSSPAAGGSNSSPSPPPKGGSGSANQTSTTPGSSPTNPPNGASYRTVSVFPWAVLVITILSMIF
ncbi:hypothetical protein Clacol_005034 [Clathrus columnatus]|uniref:Uncharacterized protein n=1 Tax=Clathrus columnatus TaxID=1419009 RepID=A0AAV5AE80_9AGAM|nr:hypothetical protein Clacol_005034 [Clathrus columnatus]